MTLKYDLAITNAKIVFKDSVCEGNIFINDGKFAAFNNGSFCHKANQIIDANGCYVLPGIIDVNIHMRVPGLDHKEDFRTGTRAAAAGGVTTILDMPNTKPPTTTVERFNEKKAIVKGNAYVDYAFHFQGATDNLEELKKISGIPSVKFFLAGHETVPTTVTDLGILYEAFEILAAKNCLATVHAENQALINAFNRKYKDRTDFKAYSDARNSLVCETSVNEVICLAKATKCKVHICHVSTNAEMLAILKAKAEGYDITCEVVPYHLYFDYNDCSRLGSFSKVSPALKSSYDQNSIKKAIEYGGVDCITSEHTPHTLEEKSQSVWKAPAGMPGVQEMLPVLYSMSLSPVTIARLCSENPSKIFGIPNKGAIQLGYDADLVIFDQHKKWIVTRDSLFSKCGWSAYENMMMIGMPLTTMVRGNIVYNDGKIIGDPIGKFIL